VTPVERFHLGPPDRDRGVAPLLDADGSTVGLVDGGVLDAQFAVADGYLVITEDEDPWENSLYLSLFSRGLERIDRVRLGIPYNGGTLRLRRVGPAEDLEFSFYGEEVWHVTVCPRPRLVLGGLFGPIRYLSGLRHRLIVSRFDAAEGRSRR